MTNKEQVLDIIKNYNPKSYSAMIKNRPDLFEYVNHHATAIGARSIPETLYCIYHDSTPVFCTCGNPALFNTFVKGYRKFCGTKCKTNSQALSDFWKNNPSALKEMLAKKEKTLLKKYGTDNVLKSKEIKDKIKLTNLKKYGVEYPIKSDVVKNKIKQTNQKRYGVDYPLQSLEIQEKTNDSFSKNYPNVQDKMEIARTAFKNANGNKNPFQVDEIKAKINDHYLKKYGVVHTKQSHLTHRQFETLSDPEKFKKFVNGKTLEVASIDLEVDANTIARYCDKYNCRDLIAVHKKSKWEHIIGEFLNQHHIKYIQNTKKIIPPLELDFYLPEHNIAFEVGSILWHSDVKSGRGKDYHYNKYKSCLDQGIRLFQWFDDELTNSMPVIQSKILYLTKRLNQSIGARMIKTIKPISSIIEAEFLRNNHIQGSSNDRNRVFGAYYNDKLIAVIAVKFKKSELEITRFATTLDATYPGLFSKMLKHVIKELKFTGTISSFSNNCHSDGNVYQQNGFVKTKELLPGYYYTLNYKERFNRQGFMKSKIQKRFGVDTSGKTEWQLMQELGYDRIWDAGKVKWCKTV
jgi:hypothetical protein